MTICQKCSYYRIAKPASQLLAMAINVADGPAANALAKIVDGEQNWLESEASIVRERASSDDDHWPERPMMSPFCALEESADVWLIPEIHNRGGKCTSSVSTDAARPRLACSDCAHRQVARGTARDRLREETIAGMVADDTLTQAKSAASDEALLTKQREGASARKALEMSGAYAAKGSLLTEPLYLDWCAKLSTPEDYVVCALRNPYASCSKWSPADHEQMQTLGTAPEVAVPPAGSPATTAAAAGHVEVSPPSADDAVPASLASPAIAAFRAPQAGQTARPSDSMQGEARAAIPDGAADELVTVMSWLLELDLTLEDRSRARDLVEALWNADPTTRQFLLEICQPAYRQCTSQHEAVADILREQAQPGLVAALRSGGSALGQLLVTEYDRVNMPLAAGDPPLTREIADAFVDVLAFIDSVCAGVDPGSPPPEARAAWMQAMASAWPRLVPPLRGWLAQMPIEWAQLRYQWQMLAPQQRQQYVFAMQGQFMQTHSVAQQVVAAASMPTTPLPATPWSPNPLGTAPPRSSGISAPAWVTADVDQGLGQEQLLDQIKAKQTQEEAAAEKEDPELAFQMKMHNRMESSARVSQMMAMEHESIMRILGNIKY